MPGIASAGRQAAKRVGRRELEGSGRSGRGRRAVARPAGGGVFRSRPVAAPPRDRNAAPVSSRCGGRRAWEERGGRWGRARRDETRREMLTRTTAVARTDHGGKKNQATGAIGLPLIGRTAPGCREGPVRVDVRSVRLPLVAFRRSPLRHLTQATSVPIHSTAPAPLPSIEDVFSQHIAGLV